VPLTFCTRSCTTDADCQGGRRTMRCLTDSVCPNPSSFGVATAVAMSVCWSESQYDSFILLCQ
jgi:hypothetical protein